MLVDFHDSSLISTSVTIVGCGEDGNDIFVMTPVVALHDKLMSSRNQCQSIIVVELLTYILAEGISSSARTDTPSRSIVGIGPEKVTHGALMRHLLHTVLVHDVVKRVDGR